MHWEPRGDTERMAWRGVRRVSGARSRDSPAALYGTGPIGTRVLLRPGWRRHSGQPWAAPASLFYEVVPTRVSSWQHASEKEL